MDFKVTTNTNTTDPISPDAWAKLRDWLDFGTYNDGSWVCGDMQAQLPPPGEIAIVVRSPDGDEYLLIYQHGAVRLMYNGQFYNI